VVALPGRAAVRVEHTVYFEFNAPLTENMHLRAMQ